MVKKIVPYLIGTVLLLAAIPPLWHWYDPVAASDYPVFERFSIFWGAVTLIGALYLWYQARRIEKIDQNLTRCQERYEKIRQTLHASQLIDPLTAIPNEYALKKELEEKEGLITRLIHLDIDAFHEINDLYSPESGDALLKQMAQLLQSYYENRPYRVYRLRSDEFVVTSTEPPAAGGLERELTALISFIHRQSFKVGEESINITVKAGASTKKEALLTTASMALKHAKRQYNNFAVFTRDMDMTATYRNNITMIRAIKKALEEDRIVLHYQPIVRVEDNHINYFECLVRLVDENGRLYYPHQFIELAKRSKTYFDITTRAIDLAMISFYNHPAHFSINLSYDDLASEDVMNYLFERIRNFPEPERIHIEILESEEIKNYDIVKEAIRKLKGLGCSISLDDFGSGHANFEHLVKLDFDMLKIDGSLIERVLDDPNARLIVETIIDFATKLGLATCVEYVSDKATYDLLKKMGVTYMQGFYLSKPKPYH